MGKPIMLREEDDARIEELKARIGAPTKVDVIRQGLALLESQAAREDKVRRWQAAVKAARRTSEAALRDFRQHSRLKRVP